MVAIWPTGDAPDFPFNDGLLVTDDHMNQILDNLDDLNTRSGTGNGTPLATRVATLETRTTDTVTSPGGIGNQQLANRLGTGVGTTTDVTTGTATAQLTSLRSRATTSESNITTLNNAVGIPWSGGTALSRIQAIEGRAKGAWQAPNSSQTVNAGAYGGSSSNDMLLSTVTTTPVGITAGTVGSGTVFTVAAGHAGWYHLSFQFDIAISSPGQVNLTIQNSAETISYGTHEAFFPGSPSYTIGTAHALVFLADGGTFKGTLGVFLSSGAATLTNANSGPGVGRTHMRAVRVA